MRIFEIFYIDEKGEFRTNQATEKEVREDYFPFWCLRMKEDDRPAAEINFENCLEDWKAMYYAVEVSNV